MHPVRMMFYKNQNLGLIGILLGVRFQVKIFPAGSPDVSEQKGSLLVGEKNRFRLSVLVLLFLVMGFLYGNGISSKSKC
jgi:hypothetical protein